MRLETKRLFLREMDEGDYAPLYAVLADPDNMRYYPYAFDEARVRRWIEVNRQRCRIFGFGLWAVCLKDSGEMIGDCGLTMQTIDGLIRPEIGYHIRADRQRRGYAKEAAAAVRDWAFANTPFRVLYAYMQADNRPSAATAEAIGMHRDGEYVNEEGEHILVYVVER